MEKEHNDNQSKIIYPEMDSQLAIAQPEDRANSDRTRKQKITLVPSIIKEKKTSAFKTQIVPAQPNAEQKPKLVKFQQQQHVLGQPQQATLVENPKPIEPVQPSQAPQAETPKLTQPVQPTKHLPVPPILPPLPPQQPQQLQKPQKPQKPKKTQEAQEPHRAPSILLYLPSKASYRTPIPIRVKCSKCRNIGVTIVKRQKGQAVYNWSIVMLFTSGFCCVPFCVKECWDVVHFCRNCEAELGRYKVQTC